MKKTILFAAALVAMTACNKNVIEVAPSDGFGYINLGITADTEMVVTKADAEVPVYNDYYVTLAGGNDTNWTKLFNEIDPEDWKVPAGAYEITVYNVTAEDAYKTEPGMVRVSGETSVTVTAGVATPCTVECKPQNSKVSFIYTDDFDTVFDEPAVSVSGTRNLNMTVGTEHSEANAAYFEVGKLTWTLTAELNGESKSYTDEVTTQKAKWTQVTFTTGSTDGQINVTITVDGKITEVHTVTATIDPISGDVNQVEPNQGN